MPKPIADLTDNETRRSSDRRPCTVEVALASEATTFRPATVLDLSAGGVKLLADPPPAPGEEIVLTFLTDDGRLFQIPATVVHYHEYGNAWAVGCRFARDLDEKDVEALM
jgi:c-di-GMP-binding flagellar brake protein YcgR